MSSTTKSPWNVASSIPSKSTSLQSIMDETLALKIQDEQDLSEFVMVSSNESPIKPPVQESQKVTNDPKTQELDADLALAMHLQQQEETAYENQVRKFRSGNSRINIASREHPYSEKLRLNDAYMRQKYDDLCGPVSSDDELENDDRRSLPLRDLHKDNEGRLISKHDLELCGKRNAKQLENRHDVILGRDFVVPNTAFNSLKEVMRKGERVKGIQLSGRVEKATRATKEGVMDERTRLILYKLVNKGEFDEVHGIVGTGKESNVYYAKGNSNERSSKVAIKVFKSTLTEFRNRAEYVTGDHRFGEYFSSKNMREQSKIWALKEFRNLNRAYEAGLPVPHPLVHKEHIILMSFIGKEGWPAPALHHVEWKEEQVLKTYRQILYSIRQLYQGARLVHADLSEYNILYYKNSVWFIDFGQAVDLSHPRHKEFLRKDIRNINTFYEKLGLELATAEEPGRVSDEVFEEYVTNVDYKLPASMIEEYLENSM